MNVSPAQLFAVLSHESRLRCLMLLYDNQELCVCDLIQVLGEPQPNVSRHLAQLRAAGLVTDRRDGQWIHYSVSRDLPDWVTTIVRTTADTARKRPPFSEDREVIARLNLTTAAGRCG